MHEKGLQRQKGVGPLVSSQEQRALLVPLINRVINRWSTAGFVPPSVYIGFRLFVLLERRSGDVSSMPWRVRGTLVSWANSSVGIQSCPTPPRRPAVRSDPTRPWYVRVLESQITGHALHEKGLQRQKGVGPLVSSQEQRALLVPLINRGNRSTAGQPRVLFPHSVYIGFRLFVLLERRSSDVSSMPWRVRGTLVLLGEQFCWHPVLPDPAPPPRRAPRPDPPVVCPGFGLDKLKLER